MIDALVEALALKDIPRTGWRRRGLDPVESVAAHSWGMALLVLAFCPPGLDRERCLIYAVLHDLAEAWTGDHPPQDGVTDKAQREDAAMVALFDRLERPDLLAIWRDYESRADEESWFVKQLDRLDMGLQAHRYAQRGLDPGEFLASARRQLPPHLTDQLDRAAPLPTSAMRFTGDPSLVALATALATERFGDRLRVIGGSLPVDEQVRAVLDEDDVPVPRLQAGGPADRVVHLGPDAATNIADDGAHHVVWKMSAPEPTLTSLRIARDALRRRLDHLVAR